MGGAMPRLRHCPGCSEGATDDHPDWRPGRLFGGGSVYHRLDQWPHEPERLRPTTPAIHDDASYRRAYGPGAAMGLGFVPETRQDHRDTMRRMGLAEGAPETPGRAPSAVEIARKRGLFDQAVRKVKRGPLC